ncbi:hypothetical protein WQ54_24775 [Bacillus sp. SA1-12]|nr:hypothetical protein WQ54_24775 [Bacillus sp. SA1-12]
MVTVKVYEVKSLVDSMEERAKSYTDLREKLEEIKNQFNDIVNLNDHLQGKGADAIKGFYLAQIDVVDAWLRLIDRNIAFFRGIAGTTEDVELSGDTIVHVPFLEDELTHHARIHKEMVSSQQDELIRIFTRIDDLISLDAFSKDRFEDHMEKAEKDRKDTVDAVEKLDSDLKSEYFLSEGDEQYVVALFGQLMEASRQGSTIQPIHFNAEAYKSSEVYQLKEQAEKQTSEYLSFKDEQEKWREELKRQEELENRPWYEKTWDGIKTFTGEITGYYDYIRASEGVDPVTGEKLTTGQRVAAGAMAAAGFIPIVGWAGRIAKGGTAIYRTAKGMHAADQALDVYRTANTFSTLEKAEMGIYGLVSANGFSEYLTGKDMFGNELTEEQKQNSLYQALGLLAVGGGAYYISKLQKGNAVYQVPKRTDTHTVAVNEKIKDVNQGSTNGGVTYYRVQGGTGNQRSREIITVKEDGTITTSQTSINVSTGNMEHAEYFLKEKRPGGHIVSFDIPDWMDEFIKDEAIPQLGYKKNPLNQGGTAPKIVDPTTPGDSFELPPIWSDWLQEYAFNAKMKK